MTSLAGKVICITGGASGIGLATAFKLTELKVKAVCIGDFNDANFEQVGNAIKVIDPAVQVVLTKLDVSSSSDVCSWIKSVVDKFGQLDGAVNCAGIGGESLAGVESPTIVGTTDECWKRVLDVHLNGTYYCTREQVRAMVKLPRSPRSIVNIGSVTASVHIAGRYDYATAKSAIIYLSKCVAKDTIDSGIRVNSISPGAVRTPLLLKGMGVTAEFLADKTEAAGFRLIDAEHVAKAAAYLLSDDASEVFGINMAVGDAGA